MTCLILAFGAFYFLVLVAVMALWPGVTPGAALALALPGAGLAAWYLVANGVVNRRRQRREAWIATRTVEHIRAEQDLSWQRYCGTITPGQYNIERRKLEAKAPPGARLCYYEWPHNAGPRPTRKHRRGW